MLLEVASNSSPQSLSLKFPSLIVRLRGLFISFRRVLETLVNLGNSEFHLIVKLGDNPITNRIRIPPKLRSYLTE